MKTFCVITLNSRFRLLLISLALLFGCAEEQLVSDSLTSTEFEMNTVEDGVDLLNSCSSCTYVVPAGITIIDAAKLGLAPGSVIGLDSRIEYGNLLFRNMVGTYDQPIVIRNCGGVARINAAGKNFGLKTENSRFFRITGGDQKGEYGIIVTGGTMGITLQHLSTQFEVDHIEIQHSGFAGIMAKTDPGCDPATWRGNFVMKAVALHNNYIHDTGGEGIYAGNSFFMNGVNTPCGKQYPHEIHYIRIFGNIVRNTGWDGIQLGSATRGASVHANIVENYGLKNINPQNSGIQIGEGTGGVCYNNLIKGGTGNGMVVLGLGDNIIYNNVIDHAGNHGVFCDERYSPGDGFVFLNNTILNPGADGIRIYAEVLPRNVIVNNLITNPQSYYTYTYPRSPEDAFVYKPADVDVVMSHNYFSMETAAIQLHANDEDYKCASTSPVIDQGADISAYSIRTDFNYKTRLRGAAYDIGAVEHF